MNKIIIFFSIMFLHSFTCYGEASTKDSIQTYIKYVEAHYTDKQLIDALVAVEEFTDCDYLTFAIIYNYVTNCTNEDAAEGIYDKLSASLLENKLFENKFINYCTQIDINFKFLDEIAYGIYFYALVTNMIDISQPIEHKALINNMINLMPQNIIEYYTTRNQYDTLYKIAEYAIANI